MIGSIRLSGSPVSPEKALFIKIYVNGSAVVNQAVAWQCLSHIPG